MFLGLDLGTTNVKALVSEASGKVVSRASAPVKVSHVGRDGVEQDIEDIWSAARQAMREVAARADTSKVQSVGISSQGGAMQVVAADGTPMGRVISWMDGRGRPYDEKISARLGGAWFGQHVGHGCSGIAVGQILRMRQEQPELLRRPNRTGFVGDAIVARLCGRAAHDATSLSIALLYNPSLRKADPDLLRELEIAEDQLPDLLRADECAGALRGDAAEAASLPAGLPVSPAVHDQYAAALGCGAVGAGDVMFGAGTAWVLLAATDRLAAPVVPEAFVCTHVVEGLYGQMLSMVNGGSSFAWATKMLGLDGKSAGEVDALLERAPAGAEGIRFWPLLAPGGGAGLGPGTAGRLSGLRLSHGPPHILRAVVEGLALELVRYLRWLSDAGVRVERLVMCGGATASRMTPQIVADAARVPVACCKEADTSALGAAILARALVERGRGLAALSRETAPAVRTCEPGPNSPLYRDMLEEYVASLPLTEREWRS
jgi:sugar (pentulose or hexulose) kinase